MNREGERIKEKKNKGREEHKGNKTFKERGKERERYGEIQKEIKKGRSGKDIKRETDNPIDFDCWFDIKMKRKEILKKR